MKSISFAALVVLFGACGGTPTNTTVTPPAGTAIGPSGGTVTSADGGATLTFPAGALSSSVSITTAAMTDPPVSPGLVTARAYDFGPSGTQFAQPVTIKLTYQPSQVPVGVSPVFLRLFVRNGSAWDSVPGSRVDTIAHTVTGTTTHFSGFAPCPLACPGTNLNPQAGVAFNPSCCLILQQGGSVTETGTVIQLNYSGSVAISVENPPSGVTGTVTVGPPNASCAAACNAAATLTLYATSSAPPGQYNVALRLAGPGAPQDSVALIPIQVTALPGYSIAVNPTSLSIAQGNTAGATVTISRTNFTAAVTLGATGLPSGVTASFNPAQLTGTTLSSLLTLTAGASVPAGTSNFAVTGTASGLANQTQTVPLTVAAFSIAGTPASIALAPGGSGSTGVKVTRAGGFSGTITYGVSGLPTGLTAAVTATSVADSSTLTVTAASNLAAGTYQIIVTATSGSSTQQMTMTVTVASSSGIHLDWSQCSTKPVWFAYQDGNGAWTHVTGSGDVYSVPTLVNGKGGIAFVVSAHGGFGTVVDYGTQAELASPVLCSENVTTTGSVTGLPAGSNPTDISLGRASITLYTAGPFTLVNGTSGTHDLVAYFQSQLGDRLFIRRGVVGGGSLAPIDFSTGTIVPSTAQVAISGSSGGTLNATMSYITGGCEAGTMYFLPFTNASALQLTGVPTASQVATDLHSLLITEFVGSIAHTVTITAHSLAGLSTSLGGVIAAPTVTTLAGPYKRLQATLSLPSDYNYVNLSITYASTGNFSSLNETTGYSGSAAITLAMPDLSGVAGFLSSWVAAASDPAQYVLNALSAPNYIAPQCGEGVTTRSSYVSGSN